MTPDAAEPPTFVHRIAADDTVEFVNDTWVRFAEANDAPALAATVIGTPLWRHVTGREVVHLWMQLVARVRETAAEVSVPFRCDSPAVRRFLRMRVVPQAGGRVEFRTRVEREEPFDRPVAVLDPDAARDPAELVRMCAWCKRVALDGGWLELEDAVEQLRLFHRPTVPTVTHGMCDDCLARWRQELG